jgi:hypothetical protein
LSKAGLLLWSESEILFPRNSASTGNDSYHGMLAMIANRHRRVPVPRRILRMLAGSSSKVVCATVLGHLIRCLYYRNGKCEPRGTCKASWIAAAFSVDARNVKAARKFLGAIGLLKRIDAPQWRLNRFGAVTLINLLWGETQSEASDSPPPERQICTGSPPPESNKELLPKYTNQKPAPSRPAGFGSAPRMANVKSQDLRSIPRMLHLHGEAVHLGLARSGEAGELAFLAAAVHAYKVATTNPAGLFATIVRKGLWHFVTQADEDHVRQRLAARWRKSTVPVQCRAEPAPESAGNVLGAILGRLGVAVAG